MIHAMGSGLSFWSCDLGQVLSCAVGDWDMISWRSWRSRGRNGFSDVRWHFSETQRGFCALNGWKPCKQTVKVTTASESDPEVRSAFRWIERVELSWLCPELASSKVSGESDSSQSVELGSSDIHDQISIGIGCCLLWVWLIWFALEGVFGVWDLELMWSVELWEGERGFMEGMNDNGIANLDAIQATKGWGTGGSKGLCLIWGFRLDSLMIYGFLSLSISQSSTSVVVELMKGICCRLHVITADAYSNFVSIRFWGLAAYSLTRIAVEDLAARHACIYLWIT